MLQVNQPLYKTYEDFPFEDLLTYAGLDCITTSGVLTKTWPKITETPEYTWYKHGKLSRNKLMSIAESMERYTMPAHEFICDMEINGIKYDVEKNKEIGN